MWSQRHAPKQTKSFEYFSSCKCFCLSIERFVFLEGVTTVQDVVPKLQFIYSCSLLSVGLLASFLRAPLSDCDAILHRRLCPHYNDSLWWSHYLSRGTIIRCQNVNACNTLVDDWIPVSHPGVKRQISGTQEGREYLLVASFNWINGYCCCTKLILRNTDVTNHFRLWMTTAERLHLHCECEGVLLLQRQNNAEISAFFFSLVFHSEGCGKVTYGYFIWSGVVALIRWCLDQVA